MYFLTTSGVAATRVSSARVSLGMPIRMAPVLELVEGVGKTGSQYTDFEAALPVRQREFTTGTVAGIFAT